MKKLLCAVCAALMCLTIIVFGACNTSPQELSAPTNVAIDANDVLTWDAVKNASSYTVDLDGMEFFTQETSFNLFYPADPLASHSVKVKAIGNKKYLDSQYSATATLAAKTASTGCFTIKLVDEGAGYEIRATASDKISGVVVLPSSYDNLPIVKIADNGFANCAAITEIVIPNSVKRIGGSAFVGCAKLERIRFPQKVLSMEQQYFDSPEMQELRLPEGPATLSVVLSAKNVVKTLALPSTVTKVNVATQENNLENIVVDKNNFSYSSEGGCLVRKSDDYVVLGSKNAVIPDYAAGIESQAFRNCAIEKITIPASVKTVRNAAFIGCTKLAEVTIEDGLKNLGDAGDDETANENGVFQGCYSLKSLAFPKSVSYVNVSAFRNCPLLKDITFDKENATYRIEGGMLINKSNVLLLALSGGTVPRGVITIGENAFQNSTATTVTLSATVKKINASAFSGNGYLENLVLNEGLNEIGESAFLNCRLLKQVVIPSTVRTIGAYAFAGCFCPVILPKEVRTIDERAFVYDTVYTDAKYSSRPSGWIERTETVTLDGWMEQRIVHAWDLDATICYESSFVATDDASALLYATPGTFSYGSHELMTTSFDLLILFPVDESLLNLPESFTVTETDLTATVQEFDEESQTYVEVQRSVSKKYSRDTSLSIPT